MLYLAQQVRELVGAQSESVTERHQLVAPMAVVRSKVLVLLLLQLVRPVIGLRFTVGDHLCGERAGPAFGQLALRRLPQVAPSLSQPRPISRLGGGSGRPYRACVRQGGMPGSLSAKAKVTVEAPASVAW